MIIMLSSSSSVAVAIEMFIWNDYICFLSWGTNCAGKFNKTMHKNNHNKPT